MLWILLAWSLGCSSYQRTAASDLQPRGVKKVSVTFHAPRMLRATDASDSTTAVHGVYGRLERVSGDTLFIVVSGGWDQRNRPVRLAKSDGPVAVAAADARDIKGYRYSGRLSTFALIGGLVLTWVIVMANACIMCMSDGSSY